MKEIIKEVSDIILEIGKIGENLRGRYNLLKKRVRGIIVWGDCESKLGWVSVWFKTENICLLGKDILAKHDRGRKINFSNLINIYTRIIFV